MQGEKMVHEARSMLPNRFTRPAIVQVQQQKRNITGNAKILYFV